MPAGDFSACSVRSSDGVKPKLGPSLLDLDLLGATVLRRVIISRSQRERNNTVRRQREHGVSLLFGENTLKRSFAGHIEIFHDNLCRFAIGADGKGDAASANSVFAPRLIGERIPVVMLHWESLVFWTLHDR